MALPVSFPLLPLLLLATPSSTVAPLYTRAALHGRPGYMEVLLVSLGMQTPMQVTALNAAEYPAVAAMTTGYVFRVENQATVMFLQRIGRPGCCVTVDVVSDDNAATAAATTTSSGNAGSIRRAPGPTVVAYIPAAAVLGYLVALAESRDVFLFASVVFLLTSRFLTIMVLRARMVPAWHGAAEPGVKGDLLVLLSRDRWIRIRGPVDDLKAVTSGTWLRDDADGALWLSVGDWLASFLVYLAVVVLANATDPAQCVLVLAALLGHAALACSNYCTTELSMHGRRLVPVGVKRYQRRLDLATELIAELGRDDWAVRLGMITPNPDQRHTARKVGKTRRSRVEEEVVTM